MGLAQEINDRLDAILSLGKDSKSQQAIQTIIEELNVLTHNGQNARNIFNNAYYINDFTQDRKIANENKNITK